MPALAKWKGHIYKVQWLGIPTSGPWKGIKRARLIPFGPVGTGPQWVDGSEIEMVDNPAKGGKAIAGKDE